MSFEERVRLSFERVREEMNHFFSEINLVKNELKLLKEELNELRYEQIKLNALKEPEKPQISNNTIKTNDLTQISTGNEGVSTLRHFDSQTDNTPVFPLDGNPTIAPNTQTHSSTHSSTDLRHIPEKLRHFDTSTNKFDTKTQQKTQISDLTKLMESLKSDLKKKFQALTKQEFYIFSVLFTLDKTQNQVTYQDLAIQTRLTSSSIRDYVQRIIKKGIPLLKEKINNRLTVLKIPPELRNLATLDNLMRIRGMAKDTDLAKFTQN